MQLKDSKTLKNLYAAFAGETQAWGKYSFFEAKAKKDGYQQIAAIFQETAKNEGAHAKRGILPNFGMNILWAKSGRQSRT